MKTYKVYGKRFFACGSNCASGFKEDRKAGLIYGAIRDADSKEFFNREEASIHFGFCAYCGASSVPDEG